MGKLLNRAKTYFGTDNRGLLEGGRYALLHTRSLEFDDLRPYVAGDDVRDIDWKATARSGTVLIKRFVSEKHHKILLIVDAGRNMSALASGGEFKRDVAVNVLGAIGLITVGRADEIGMVYGDARGSVNVRGRRGETHIENLLSLFYVHSLARPGASNIVDQLTYAATGYRRRMLIVVVSDEPDVSEDLDTALKQLCGRHDVMWAMISDMPAVGSVAGEHEAYDVATGGYIPSGAALGPRVIDAYRRAEQARAAQLEQFLTSHRVVHTKIGASTEIRAGIVTMAEAFDRA